MKFNLRQYENLKIGTCWSLTFGNDDQMMWEVVSIVECTTVAQLAQCLRAFAASVERSDNKQGPA